MKRKPPKIGSRYYPSPIVDTLRMFDLLDDEDREVAAEMIEKFGASCGVEVRTRDGRPRLRLSQA